MTERLRCVAADHDTGVQIPILPFNETFFRFFLTFGLATPCAFLLPLLWTERTPHATVAAVIGSPHGFAYAVDGIAKRCGEHNTYYNILGSHLFFHLLHKSFTLGRLQASLVFSRLITIFTFSTRHAASLHSNVELYAPLPYREGLGVGLFSRQRVDTASWSR